jgi:hypothetical protein
VDLDVVRGRPEQGGIVSQQSQCEVAALAQKRTHEAVRMIVIEMFGMRVAADRAEIALLGANLIHRFPRNAVLAQPVRLAAGSTVARLALAAEP